MPTHYQYECRGCGWTGERYRNVKRCPKCHKDICRVVPPTPAPWRPATDAQGICGLMHPTKNGVAVAWFSECHVPAKGYVGDQKEDRIQLGRPERQANARLIMAAPEMYAALKEVAESDPRDEMSQFAFANLKGQCKRALAKAEKGE